MALAGAGRVCRDGACLCQGLAIMLPRRWLTEEPLGQQVDTASVPSEPPHTEAGQGSHAGAMAAPWKEEREITEGKSVDWEKVIKQVLEAGAEVDMLLLWAALPDRTCPMPRVGHLSFDSRGCWGVCFLGPETSRCCTGSLHGQFGMFCCPLIWNFYLIVYMNSGSCCLGGISPK